MLLGDWPADQAIGSALFSRSSTKVPTVVSTVSTACISFWPGGQPTPTRSAFRGQPSSSSRFIFSSAMPTQLPRLLSGSIQVPGATDASGSDA